MRVKSGELSLGGDMECNTVWKEGMWFESRVGDFSIPMDASEPLGHHQGPNPKDLLAASLAGCTGMDIVGILKKNKQFIKKFEIETHVESTDSYPKVFSLVEHIFKLEGSIDEGIALEALQLSQSRYCGITAMLSSTVPIRWRLFVNGKEVEEGQTGYFLSKE
jgi:putative redox protein